MVNKEYLSSILNKFTYEELDIEKKEFIDGNILGKTSKDIADKLISTPPPECGGITAITGFYYQFLVSIEYLIELYQDKWDYVGIELFDDVIAIKDNTVRFIQVKTSHKSALKITDPSANKLYLRSHIKGTDLLHNDNWIDKLISKAKYFKKSENYYTEFELATSFTLLGSDKYKEIPVVFINDDGDIDIDNKIIVELIKDVHSDDGKRIEYEELYGESILDLLSRVKIKERSSIRFIDEYESKVCTNLQKALFEDEKIHIPIDQIKNLVGEIASRCQVNKESKALIFDKEQIYKLFEKIKQQSINESEISLIKHNNMEYIDEVLNSICNKYKTSSNNKYINNYIFKTRNYIKGWVAENGGMNALINRLVDGSNNSYKNRDIDVITKKSIIQKFFNIIIILNATNDIIAEYLSNQTLLVKRYNGDEGILSTFISMCEKDIEYGFKKIEEIITNSDLDEQTHFMNKRLKIVFQDYLNDKEEFDDYKEKIIKFKLKPQIDGIGNVDSLNEVFIVADAVPGHTIIEEATRIIKRNDKGIDVLLLGFINNIMGE